MVPGVIVHWLCISVILPSCDDRYYSYSIKTFISVCELLWACWLPMCCYVNTLNLRQWYLGDFWGSWNRQIYLFFIIFYFLSKRDGGQLYMAYFSTIPSQISPDYNCWLSISLASKCCRGIVVQTDLNMITWRQDTERNTSNHQTQMDKCFAMVFSILNTWNVHGFFIRIWKKPHVRTSLAYLDEPITFIFFYFQTYRMFHLGLVLYSSIWMTVSPVMSYGIWQKGFSCT